MTIRSMTGYGQASAELLETRVTVELRSVNHRYADLRFRLPGELAAQEGAIRRKVLSRIRRGRVELSVSIDPLEAAGSRPQLNQLLLKEVLAASKTLHDEHQIEGRPDMKTLLMVPGMFRPGGEPEWGEPEQEALNRALESALVALEEDRRREGAHLQEEMLERLEAMTGLAAAIGERASQIPGAVRERLLERLEKLSASVELDPTRVAQEAAMLADRCDVTEEVVRLRGHLEQLRELVGRPDGEPVGKRIDFLLQELNRETNTINSKSADLELSRNALALKADIEKVREQVQNLE